VGLSVSKTEEISRDEYDTMIRDPLRAMFKERSWWTLNEPRGGPVTVTSSSIRFVAMIKGMPLKIRPAPNYPGDKPGGPPLGDRNDARSEERRVGKERRSWRAGGAESKRSK